MSWYIKVLKNYAVFRGRARRREYWMFSLFNFIFLLVLAVIDIIITIAFKTDWRVLAVIYVLATLIPTIAVGVRRLHDTNHSGWWYFISLVPLVGGIILIVYFVIDSQPGENRYGPNPKTEAATAV